MGCYIIPAIAALSHYFIRKKNPKIKNNKHHLWLNLLFLGGTIFGIIDHLWNRELFLFGKNTILDLALGVTITLVILIAWRIIVYIENTSIKTTKTTN